MKECKKGDKVKCYGITATIDRVISQFKDGDGLWDIEFYDTAGNYRHWKQRFDGGTLVAYKD